MRRFVLASLPLLLAPVATHAQALAEGDRLATELRLTGLAFDNLFQAPEGAPQEDVYGGNLEGRFAWRLAPASAWRLYGRAGATGYDHSELDPSQAVGLGLRGDGDLQGLDLFAEYANDRPSVDLDEFDQADIFRATADYELRPVRVLSFGLGGVYETQSFAAAERRDNEFTAVGASVRLRASRVLSPEVGWSTGTRDVDDPVQSYDQDEWWARLILQPSPSVYLGLRYRLRERDYTTDQPLASNFGREDDRTQWSLTGSFKTSPLLEWLLYYAHEQSESSRPATDFTTQMLQAGVAFHF